MIIKEGYFLNCFKDGYMTSDKRLFCKKGKLYKITNYSITEESYVTILDENKEIHFFESKEIKRGTNSWFTCRGFLIEKMV